MEFDYRKLDEKMAMLEGNILNLLHDDNHKDYKNEISEKKESEKLKIAVCGQYSAGKSSIITALTGRKDIKIGQGITTDEVTEYDWGGIQIADTPGIMAGREDHDEKSLKYIKKADLLVYVLTINGFEREIKRNFEKLAFENKYLPKMMLVMNKKSMESSENYENWIQDLKNNLSEEVFEKLNVSVIDAKTYIEAQSEKDREIKDIYIEESSFNKFKESLNSFVEGNGLKGKIISRMNVCMDILKKIDISCEDSEKQKIDMNLELLKSKMKKLESYIREEALDVKREIISKGSNLKNKITAEDIEQFDDDSKQMELELEYYLREVNEKIDEQINRIFEDIREEIELIEKYAESDYSVIEDKKLNIENKLSALSELKDITATSSKILEASGKAINNIDKNTAVELAKIFNVKFKPWGKAKLHNKFKFGGKILSGLGAAVEIFSKFQEEQEAANLRKARREVAEEFEKISQEVEENILALLKNEEGPILNLKNITNQLESRKKELLKEEEKNKIFLMEVKKIATELDSFQLS